MEFLLSLEKSTVLHDTAHVTKNCIEIIYGMKQHIDGVDIRE